MDSNYDSNKPFADDMVLFVFGMSKDDMMTLCE